MVEPADQATHQVDGQQGNQPTNAAPDGAAVDVVDLTNEHLPNLSSVALPDSLTVSNKNWLLGGCILWDDAWLSCRMG